MYCTIAFDWTIPVYQENMETWKWNFRHEFGDHLLIYTCYIYIGLNLMMISEVSSEYCS